jgi:hypothetical protein
MGEQLVTLLHPGQPPSRICNSYRAAYQDHSVNHAGVARQSLSADGTDAHNPRLFPAYQEMRTVSVSWTLTGHLSLPPNTSAIMVRARPIILAIADAASQITSKSNYLYRFPEVIAGCFMRTVTF